MTPTESPVTDADLAAGRAAVAAWRAAQRDEREAHAALYAWIRSVPALRATRLARLLGVGTSAAQNHLNRARFGVRNRPRGVSQ